MTQNSFFRAVWASLGCMERPEEDFLRRNLTFLNSKLPDSKTKNKNSFFNNSFANRRLINAHRSYSEDVLKDVLNVFVFILNMFLIVVRISFFSLFILCHLRSLVSCTHESSNVSVKTKTNHILKSNLKQFCSLTIKTATTIYRIFCS